MTDDRVYRLTTAGYALVGAKVGSGFKRATAQRALDAMLVRVEEANASPKSYVTITKVVLFGSMLDESVEVVGDVDVAIQIVGKELTGKVLADATSRLMGNRAGNTTPRAGDPIYYFNALRYLKAGKAVLSPVDWDEHQEFLATVPTRTIFEAPPPGTLPPA